MDEISTALSLNGLTKEFVYILARVICTLSFAMTSHSHNVSITSRLSSFRSSRIHLWRLIFDFDFDMLFARRPCTVTVSGDWSMRFRVRIGQTSMPSAFNAIASPVGALKVCRWKFTFPCSASSSLFKFSGRFSIFIASVMLVNLKSSIRAIVFIRQGTHKKHSTA